MARLNAEELELRKRCWLKELEAGATLQVIADTWGVTRERVRQVVGPDSPRQYKIREARLKAAFEMFPDRSARDISGLAGFVTPQVKRLRALGWTPPARPEMKHGASRYQMKGCRCEVCREAVRERSRAFRERHKGHALPERLHGKASTYSNYGCRCEACRTAAREAQRGYRVKREAKKTPPENMLQFPKKTKEA